MLQHTFSVLAGNLAKKGIRTLDLLITSELLYP